MPEIVTSNSESDVSDAVAELFTAMGITRVVVVDDAFSTGSDLSDVVAQCMDRVRTNGAEGLREIPVVGTVALVVEDEDVSRQKLERALSDVDAAELKKIAIILADLKDGASDAEEKAYESMKAVFKKCNLDVLSLTEWQNKKDSLLTGESLNGTLFLFDQVMTGDGGVEDEGIRIIAELLRTTAGTQVYCGLLSHTVQPNEEFSTWEGLATEYDIIKEKDRFTVISKELMRDDPIAFCKRLKRVVITGHCGVVKEIVFGLLDEAHNEAKNRINELSIFDFEQIVFSSSAIEGIWEPETLFRLYGLFHGIAAKKAASNNPNLEAASKNVRRLASIHYDSKDAPKSSARKIRHQELYEDGEFINKYHYPLSLGDVFRNEENGNRFILIAQPCDLMVRGNGKRAGRDHVVLAKVKNTNSTNNVPCFKLQFFGSEGNETQWVWYRDCMTVPLECLDLAVFNQDGSLQLAVESSAPDGLIPAWQKRFVIVKDDLQKKMKRLVEVNEKLKGKADKDCSNLIQDQIFHVVKGYLRNKVDQSSKTVSYGLVRECRLRAAHSSALLRQFAIYHSRDAFEHDFMSAFKDESDDLSLLGN